MKEQILELDLDKVEIKDQAHRTKLDIESLAESIESVGQINPITVNVFRIRVVLPNGGAFSHGGFRNPRESKRIWDRCRVLTGWCEGAGVLRLAVACAPAPLRMTKGDGPGYTKN